MSAIVEIQERLQSTVTRIAEYEKAASLPDAPRSLFVGIRSLEKLKMELERDFIQLARHEEIEVCKYRLLPEQGTRPTITAIAKAWTRYQALFSSVYDALTTGPTHRRTRKQSVEQTQFALAYTFSGSIGVVLTLPSRQLQYSIARELERTTQIIFEMAKSQTPENLASFVERFGVPPVAKLGQWVDAHVDFAAGAGVQWEISATATPPQLLIQIQEFKMLKRAMDQISTPVEITEPLNGLLLAANIRRRSFLMRLDTGEEISGTFADAINETHRAELPQRYEALIRTTKTIKPALEKVDVERFLVQLVRRLG